MARPEAHINTASELDALFHRAKAEEWKELALINTPLGYVGAIPRHVFSVSAEAFSGIPEKLPPLGDLIALALYASTQDLGGLKFLQSLNKLTVLEIGWSRIGHAGAEAIAKLAKNLISLDLLSDDIGDDGARAIATLTKLTSLALYNNEIGDDGAKTIATLTKLKSLDLSNNKIGDDGANAIAALTNLTSLDLTDNQIGDDGAKAIATLTKLTSLDLSNNKIGDDGAKAIATLTELQSLDLSNNKIGEEGAKAILDGWSASPLTDQFRRLNLQKNGDFGDLLPKEVLETVDAQAVLATYRRFRNAEAAGRLRPLDESKLLVVGNEAVGKTSLLRYLIDGKPRDPSEAKTPGIATREKIEIKDWSPTKSSVHLNVWDFGGQEMMRGTHRFFLTARSLYLLVLEDRRQDDRSIHVWLKTIRNRGQDSPIIVVINKSDRGKQDLRLPEPELREAYSNIVGFLRTSCDDDDWGRASIEALRQHIAETIIGHANLKHVRDQVPEVWLEVKRAVVERAKAAQVLTIDQFRQLCEATDGRGERITDPAEQRRLLGVLHDLGTVVAYGLDRDAPAARREITLLDPNWLTGAVYRVLDRASSVEQEGEFSRHQLNKWLDPDLYPPERHEFILGMMQDEEIGLCFRLPDAREERYLVPEALPASARFYGKWPRDSLRFRYVYNFLPPGLVPRFIVEAHQSLTPERSRWRTGVVLKVRDCPILVRANGDQPRIDVEVEGPSALRRSALNVVLDDFEAVHKLNPECGPEARVPFPGRPEKDIGYEYLRDLEERYGLDHQFFPEGADRDYTVGELLEGVRRERTPFAGRRELTSGPHPKAGVDLHVVILVHGIRTRAIWQSSIRDSLENYGFIVELTNYGYFDLVRFLLPFSVLRRKPVDNITRQLRDIVKMNPQSSVSVIAHSFGTFVISEIMRRHPDINFHKVIFCGSVVKYNFPFDEFSHRFDTPIINEVGTRDVWPALAEAITWGYGSAGTYGFRRPRVRDRWHIGKTHSAFLTTEFCHTYWIPFLKNSQVEAADREPASAPWWLEMLKILQVKYITAVSILLMIVLFSAPFLADNVPWMEDMLHEFTTRR